MTLFVLCEKGLKTYPHADAKQRKTLLWPKRKKQKQKNKNMIDGDFYDEIS
jgi:hypothetical protein